MWQFHTGSWHRYTRWTGRLSHQTSDLSHPHNLLQEGCVLCFTWYQVQGGVGSELPGYHQTTKVTQTEGSPERSGYMHMDKQVTHSILDMLFSMRGTETAKVEGLWLVNRPKCLVPEYPDDSPEVRWWSPFIVPSLYSMRDPHDVMKWHHNHLLWSSSGKTTVHVHRNCWHLSVHLPASLLEPPNTTNASKPLCLFLNPIFAPVTYIMGCIWQPFCILQEKVRISCYFWIIRVVNSQLALYSDIRCNLPWHPWNTHKTPPHHSYKFQLLGLIFARCNM